MKKLIIIFLPLVITSCTNIFEQKEYVSVYIENQTEEDILVYTGMYIMLISVPSAIIQTGNSQSVLTGKGENVSVSGKDSGKNYGSRTFFFESQWIVY